MLNCLHVDFKALKMRLYCSELRRVSFFCVYMLLQDFVNKLKSK